MTSGSRSRGPHPPAEQTDPQVRDEHAEHQREASSATPGNSKTYYHRIRPERRFGLQRVYSDDRSLDKAIAFGDRDCVLVPRGYRTVSTPPGYDLYYLNVMAGPIRIWAVTGDADHEWTITEPLKG